MPVCLYPEKRNFPSFVNDAYLSGCIIQIQPAALESLAFTKSVHEWFHIGTGQNPPPAKTPLLQKSPSGQNPPQTKIPLWPKPPSDKTPPPAKTPLWPKPPSDKNPPLAKTPLRQNAPSGQNPP